ncbi:sigma-54 dependent transcriptional regulator [Cellulophaga baltica]|uniref:sigma-54-dependent transcriptional regulator n=1 Tax=Cellulophaga TaxID=104264 RepID=UPI001C06FC38|nr:MULTISPECIES: sigma-54 dependent transcriptional regulator [Cellulophaga]MBU2995588.1 sigma-54 dependent transcriptional regulator [Cellulophaga baltica]MDO6766982.1 sigma-54 dependent transcriptional regulator [Cellulophaga sp. 1_MG-2023]
MPKILIIEDDTAFCQMLQKFLTKKEYDVEISFSAEDGIKKFKSDSFDAVITDLRLPNYDGIQLLTDIKTENPKTPVIVMTGYAEVSTAVRAMKKGAFDYISKPFTPEEIVMLIKNALQDKAPQAKTKATPKAENTTATAVEVDTTANNGAISGISDASKKLNEYINLVAPTDMSLLITGESGTGKEVTAKAIHDKSKRSAFNFVAVDCGAIPKEIATSEFFGHIKGSFTGAIEDKIGHFEAANGGTLFLDEIGNLSYENQIQLLRALQERKIKRVGSTKEIDVDVRIITATNEDLLDAVEKGNFREDLYHRINEFSIEIPSLYDRLEDLHLFADFFLDKANASLGKNVFGFSDETIAVFRKYHWPGNLRELQNIIKRSVLLTTGDYIEITVLPKELFEENKKPESTNFSKDAYEKEQILRALKEANFNKSKAAKLLQITRKTLYNKINHYNLDL